MLTSQIWAPPSTTGVPMEAPLPALMPTLLLPVALIVRAFTPVNVYGDDTVASVRLSTVTGPVTLTVPPAPPAPKITS